MMYKKIKNNILRIILIALTFVLGIPIAYWLFVYLIAPRYQFKVGQPFHGEYLYNPYQDMDPDQWKQYNFSEQTDIPVQEHGYGFFRKTHQLCIGPEKTIWMDFPFMQSLDLKQHMLNVLHQHTRFAIPAHATHKRGYDVSDMHYLSGYRLLEVGNPLGCAFDHWDAALSTGHRVYGIGDNNAHRPFDINKEGSFSTMINTRDTQADSVYAALEKGCAYTVELHSQPDKLYHLTRCELIGDTLVIETDAPLMQAIDFIGQESKILDHMEQCQQARYVIQPSDAYVRTKLMIDGKTFFYLNPITRQATAAPIDNSTAEINWPQTVMFYVIYLIVIGVCILRIIKRN